MACEAERTNVEFLELLEEMAEREKDDAFGAVNEAMHELSDSCGGHFIYGDDPTYNVMINVPTLAEFLERLSSGELSPECEQLFDDVISRVHEAQDLVDRRNQVRDARREAQERLRDCTHATQPGPGGA